MVPSRLPYFFRRHFFDIFRQHKLLFNASPEIMVCLTNQGVAVKALEEICLALSSPLSTPKNEPTKNPETFDPKKPKKT
jgi:hypothetical protein